MSLYENNPTDPKKTTKTVTRGKPTTTTSTRRGENSRGILGTFTDTTTNTPVTTNTSGGGGGSDKFNTAFAAASAAKKPSFIFGNKEYTTEHAKTNTSNESSTTSTFKADKLKPLPPLKPAGISFSPQSYKLGKTQTIQRPGADAMHSLSVGRNSPQGETRDYHLVQEMGDGPGYFQGGQAITQDMRLMTLDQKEGLIKNVDLHNKLLKDKYSEEAITANITKNYKETKDPRVIARREKHLKKKIAEGQTRIENNSAFYKVPGEN